MLIISPFLPDGLLVLVLVSNERKYALENCRALCKWLLTYYHISHGEILKLYSIWVCAKFWNVGHFPELHLSWYILIHYISYLLWIILAQPGFCMWDGGIRQDTHPLTPWCKDSLSLLLQHSDLSSSWAPVRVTRAQWVPVSDHGEQCAVTHSCPLHTEWSGRHSISSTSTSAALCRAHRSSRGLVEWLKNVSLF